MNIPFSSLPEKIYSYIGETNFLDNSHKKPNFPFGQVRKDMPAKKTTGKEGEISYTFVLTNIKSEATKSPSDIYFDNLVIFESVKSKNFTYIIRYEPTEEWYSKSKDFKNYSGKITFYTVEGDKLNGIEMAGGEMLEKNASQNNKGSCALIFDHAVTICTPIYISDMGFVDVCNTTYYYNLECTSTGGDPGDNYDYSNESGDDPGEFPSTGGVYTPPTIPDPEPEEITVKVDRDSSFVANQKINCTYERLIEENSIGDILIDFFGEDALFDVTFNVVENLNCNGNTNASGCTTPLDGDAYRIDIDLDYINNINTPTIFLAQTLVHEAIHANLFAAVKKLNYGISPSDTSFEGLYEEYRKLQNWQHEYMADHYTGIMQDALREVHPLLNDSIFLNNYDNNSLWDWDEFYEYMSFRGLEDTQAGSEYFNDNSNSPELYSYDAEAFSTKNPNCDE